MHHVEPPKDGHGVEHHMLQVDHEIEENDPTGHFHPEGKMVCVQQAPPLFLGFCGYRQRKGCKQQPDERRIEKKDPKVGRPADPPGADRIVVPEKTMRRKSASQPLITKKGTCRQSKPP